MIATSAPTATIAHTVGGATFWAAQKMITASIATTVSIALGLACVEKIATLMVCRTHGPVPLMGSIATRIETSQVCETALTSQY